MTNKNGNDGSFLKCGTHGRQRETFVCRHIVESIAAGESVGFFWGIEDGVHEALCEACNSLSADAFAEQAQSLIQPLCYGCFREAGALNGVVID